MKYLTAVAMMSLLFVLSSLSYALDVGDRAPLFQAESTQGTISLESYAGTKNVVLAFYYADFTPV